MHPLEKRFRYLLNKGGLLPDESVELQRLAKSYGVKIQLTRYYFNGREPFVIYKDKT